jgi:hypothetical protein
MDDGCLAWQENKAELLQWGTLILYLCYHFRFSIGSSISRISINILLGRFIGGLARLVGGLGSDCGPGLGRVKY